MSIELRTRREEFLVDNGSEADNSDAGEFQEAKIVVKGGTNTALCALIANLEGNLMRVTHKKGALEREVDTLETRLRYNVLELNNAQLATEELRKFRKEAWVWRGALFVFILFQVFKVCNWLGFFKYTH